MSRDLTALSYWFPKVEAAGLPVPKTVLLDMPKEAQEAVWGVFDGQEVGDIKPFLAAIDAAATALGYPCFLRTDHSSGKHNWRNTCHLSDAGSIGSNVFAIAEYSEINGMFGELPWAKWVVREMLPTKPVGICTTYGDMPICKEFRFFVENGKVRCRHPYWPLFALEQGGADFGPGFDYDEFCSLSPEDETALTDIAEAAGRVLGGSWSVDLLETERGWFLTDMAEARTSYHWEGCLNDFRSAA